MPSNPDALVATQWASEHRSDPDVVFAEVDEDTTLYDKGHIPGAVGFHWQEDFQHPVRRTFLDREGFERLLSDKGISNDDHVVLYGGNNNWFAAYAYWYFKVYGHERVSLIDGGRKKWELEQREFLQDEVRRESTQYRAKDPDESIRARRDQILDQFVGASAGTGLVDVRSPEEFRGEKLAPDHLPGEAAQRPGHIPGATNIPWSKAVNQDTGEFLSEEQLRELYGGQGITPDKEVVAYCRIGERSAHTWFVLHELLGYDNVRNYDGSWTEYGSLVDVPIERG
ncbi:MAG TPA: sulfurtransferase [Nitriliruptorales bacterium]|nr:sulfurtransferase [Nitriliruptorales bacterium]